MLDDHVRVDDAHRRKRIGLRDGAMRGDARTCVFPDQGEELVSREFAGPGTRLIGPIYGTLHAWSDDICQRCG
jgi:hypothetical protein